jgi:hypothetical protein
MSKLWTYDSRVWRGGLLETFTSEDSLRVEVEQNNGEPGPAHGRRKDVDIHPTLRWNRWL